MDRIELVSLKLDCIVGVLDAEQRRVQPLEGSLVLWLDLDAAGDSGRLDQTVDYAAVAARLSFVAAHGRFRLLESMAVAMLRLVLLSPAPGEERAAVARARVGLRKPAILGELATPGIAVERDAAWAERCRRVGVGEGATADVLVDTGREGAWRIHLAPGARWDPGEALAVHVIAGRIARDDRFAAGPGTSIPAGDLGPVTGGPEGATLLGVRVPPPPDDR